MQASDRILPKLKAVTFSQGKCTHAFNLNLKQSHLLQTLIILNIVHPSSVTHSNFNTRPIVAISHPYNLIQIL